MMASILDLSDIVCSFQFPVASKKQQPNLTKRGSKDPPTKYQVLGTRYSLPPVVSNAGVGAVEHFIELQVLLHDDLAEGLVLANQNRLQADEFQHREECAH